MPKLTIAMLGLTHPHSIAHLRTLETSSEVEAVVLWDSDPSTLEGPAADVCRKVVVRSTELDKVIEDSTVQAVLVALPNRDVPDVVISAAEAGKHIFCEKPAAAALAGLRSAAATVEKTGVHFSICYPWPFSAPAREIRRLIDGRALGDIMHVETRMITSQVKFRNPKHWLFRKKISGGGILSWLGCHWIDLARFLLAEEVESVSAVTATLSGEHIDVEDTASVTMRFRSGALASLQAGYMLPKSKSGYQGATYDSYVALRGTLGNVRWEPMEPEWTIRIDSVAPEFDDTPHREMSLERPECPAYGGAHGLAFFDAFARAVMGDGEPPNSIDDAIRVMEIIDAAYESARTGRHVRLSG